MGVRCRLPVVTTAPILITAFDPFGGDETNASQLLLELLPGHVAGVPLTRLLLPTQFWASGRDLIQAIDRLRPRAVVSLGQAAGRRALTPERIAINVDDARIPDNAGSQPLGDPIAPGGPAAYFTTLPVRAMIAAMRHTGMPAELSNTAGTFVCNHVMYLGLHHLATTRRAEVPAGFIHVPAPGDMDVDTAVRALIAALEVVARGESDIPLAVGETD